MKSFVPAIAVALVLTSVPSAASVEEDLDRCRAVTLEELPPGGQKGDWDSKPYARRHARYLETHPRVFASGFLSGKHFYIGFTRDVCKHLRHFRIGLEQPWRVRAFDANFSYRRMTRAIRCVADMSDNERLGISLVGDNVHRNEVEVLLERNTEWRRKIIRRRCDPDWRPILYFREGRAGPT